MEAIKFKEFFSRKPTIINFSIIILVIVLYLSLFFRPRIKETFSKLTEVSRLKAKVVNTEREWANIDSLKKQVSQLDEKIDYYEKRLPSEKEKAALLKFLSDSAKELNVRITEIKPIEQDKDKKLEVSIYYQVPILLIAECGYHQLGRFLNELERADRLMKISDIKIKARGNILNVQLIVVTYVMSQG